MERVMWPSVITYLDLGTRKVHVSLASKSLLGTGSPNFAL